MATAVHTLPLENCNVTLQQRFIVQLRDSGTVVRHPNNEMTSGFIRILSVEHLRHEDEVLKKHFKFWMSSMSEGSLVNAEQEPMHVTQKDFTDVLKCSQFIQSCPGQSVILTLSHSHSQNKELILRVRKLRQIIFIYRSIPEADYDELLDRWSLQERFFAQDILPRSWTNTAVHNIDSDGQLLLMEIFLLELIVNIPTDDKAKDDFLSFCHSRYKDDPAYETLKQKIERFKDTYNPEDAIKWYTNPESFIFQMVGKTFGTIDMITLFKIRFIVHDMYKQLEKLHGEQLQTKFQENIEVFRGIAMSIDVLNRFKNREELFITRNFLSTSMKKDVAGMFSGNGQAGDGNVSVIICMKIERSVVQDKPIACISDHSAIMCEEEVMLPMGLVFRVDPNRVESEDSTGTIIINMIRGEDEKRIEKTLQEFHLSGHVGGTAAIFGMAGFLSSIQNGQHLSTYVEHMSNALQSTNPQVAEQLSGEFYNEISNVEQGQMTTTNPFEPQPIIEVPNERIHNSGDASGRLTEQSRTNTNATNAFTGLRTILSTPKRIFFTVLVAIAVLLVIVIPIAVTQAAKSNSNAVATRCPIIVCSIVTDVRNPSSNYQVEQLNLTCSETLINMTIIQTIQRINNEIHAQQDQTFSNQIANKTYVATPTQLIYYWWSLPGMSIVKESFPHFIRAQYYYKFSSIRDTSFDTWNITLQSICGRTRHFYGTFSVDF